ncbi:MAG: GrpB family protein [Gemmatimonadaceae bacterium]
MALGLSSGTVRVVPYDPAWPRLFTEEADRIRGVLGDLPVVLEHTGSTAVPGLAAKPILDILGGHPQDGDVSSYIAAIKRAGYVHRGEQGIPGRHFFRRGDPRSFHLHLAVRNGSFWREHLTFRDALRRDPGLRAEYEGLKLALAARYPSDRESYIDGKTAFVRNVLMGLR